MALLGNIGITTAVAALTTPVVYFNNGAFSSALFQANFTYGSGGATVDAWVQTSVDGGNTFFDAMNFHFTTASATFLFNLSGLTPITAEYTPVSGSLAANTCKDGLLGSLWRIYYTTTGTYAGATLLRIDMNPRGPYGASAT